MNEWIYKPLYFLLLKKIVAQYGMLLLLLSRFSRVNSVRPHRWQPTRLRSPWDSPGKNTGVGCHFLLQCMKVKSESEVAQSCLTPSDPMDCSPPGSSIHGIFQARVLEWGQYGIGDLNSLIRDWIEYLALEAQSLYHWTTREVPISHFQWDITCT